MNPLRITPVADSNRRSKRWEYGACRSEIVALGHFRKPSSSSDQNSGPKYESDRDRLTDNSHQLVGSKVTPKSTRSGTHPDRLVPATSEEGQNTAKQ